MGEAQLKAVNNKVSIEDFDLEAVQKNANLIIGKLINAEADVTIAVKENDRNDVVEVGSRDLSVDSTPLMFASVYVVSWGSFINDDNKLFIRFQYFFENFKGGSNGCPIATVLFDADGGAIEVNSNHPN